MPDRKSLYLDCETTGTDPRQHGLIQLACLIDINGEVVDEANWHIKPFPSDVITDEALQVNGITKQELEQFPEPNIVSGQICRLFAKHIDKYDRSDKFWPAGQNVRFDLEFLRAFFEKNGDVYFGSWQNWRAVDMLAILYYLAWQGKVSLPDFRLATACEFLGVELKGAAHDALADIRATRLCILRLQEKFPIAEVTTAPWPVGKD